MARIRSIHPSLWTDEARISRQAITHIYIVQEGDDGPCKIGIARNAFWRRSALQSGNHRRLHLRAVYEADDRRDAIMAEASVLSNFSAYHLSGEWLDVTPDIIARFLGSSTING